eukprot:scaffold105672_cov34-Tisochrysis_lutea.AAC.3
MVTLIYIALPLRTVTGPNIGWAKRGTPLQPPRKLEERHDEELNKVHARDNLDNKDNHNDTRPHAHGERDM